MKWGVLLLALSLPASLSAQGARHSFVPPLPESARPSHTAVDSTAGRSDLTLAFSGAMGGVGGILLGGLVGARLEMAGGCRGDWCGFGGALLGAAIGSTVLIPAAVHFGNDQAGDFGAGLAASAAALGAGVALALISQDGHPMLIVPVAQIIGAVAVERRTSRPR
jgi:hypothetical protein